MKYALKGALAGLVATAPMSLTMELLRRRLPWRERHPLPPHHITGNVAQRVGLKPHMGQDEHRVATWISHFSYGAAAGAVYGPLAKRVPLPPLLKGVLFGLAVWTVSYMGLLPAANLFPHATEQSPRRNALMIFAHVIWGAALGLSTAAMTSEER